MRMYGIVVVVRRGWKGEESSVYKPYNRHIASHIAICRPHLLLILIAITNHQTGSDGLWNLISVQSLKRDLPGLFSILTIWNLGELCLFLAVGAKGSRQIGTKWSLGMRRLWFPMTSFPNQLWTSHEEREFWQKKDPETSFCSRQEPLLLYRILAQGKRKW